MGRRKGPPWTDEERERLVAMKAAGTKHAAIAATLGRSAGAVSAELYHLRHPGRQEAIRRAYLARHAERVRERHAARYQAERPTHNARGRTHYAAHRERVLAKQAERRREQPGRLREIRRASNARNRATRNEGTKARFAVAQAKGGEGRRLALLTGLGAEEVMFWFPRLPPGCTARAIVEKLRQVAELLRENREGDGDWRQVAARRRATLALVGD